MKDLITEHIDSVVQLEVLLLLHSRRNEKLSATDVAQTLRIDPGWTDAALTKLVSAGILERSDSLYSYSPKTSQLDQTIAVLAQAYDVRRVSIISMIYSKPLDPIRQFSDAFRFKKEEGN